MISLEFPFHVDRNFIQFLFLAIESLDALHISQSASVGIVGECVSSRVAVMASPCDSVRTPNTNPQTFRVLNEWKPLENDV